MLYISQYDSHSHPFIFPNGIAKLPEEKAPKAIKNKPKKIFFSIMGSFQTNRKLFKTPVK